MPVPESQGNFPLGYITVAFDKEFPPYSPVVLLYQQHLAEKRGLGVRYVPFDIEDKNRISEFRRADLLQHGGFDVLLTTMNSYALWGGPNVGKVTAVIGESAGADKAVVQGARSRPSTTSTAKPSHTRTAVSASTCSTTCCAPAAYLSTT